MRCQLRFEIFNSPFEIIAECRECAYMLAQLLDHANTPRGVVAMNAFENAHRRVRSLRLEGSEPIVVALALGNQCSNIVDGHVAQLLHESPSGVKPVKYGRACSPSTVIEVAVSFEAVRTLDPVRSGAFRAPKRFAACRRTECHQCRRFSRLECVRAAKTLCNKKYACRLLNTLQPPQRI